MHKEIWMFTFRVTPSVFMIYCSSYEAVKIWNTIALFEIWNHSAIQNNFPLPFIKVGNHTSFDALIRRYLSAKVIPVTWKHPVFSVYDNCTENWSNIGSQVLDFGFVVHFPVCLSGRRYTLNTILRARGILAPHSIFLFSEWGSLYTVCSPTCLSAYLPIFWIDFGNNS